MSWSGRSTAVLALSIVCLMLALVFLLTGSGDRGQEAVRITEPSVAATATPIAYLDSPFPWRTPIPRPEPVYGPLPLVTPPGADLKPPAETPGATLTAAQLRPEYMSTLGHILLVLQVMEGDTSACTDRCLM